MVQLTNEKDEFAAITDGWQFGKLCQDLAALKGKSLSHRETQWLQYLLLGYSPQDINKLLGGNDNSNALRTDLAKHLYPLLKQLIHQRERCKIVG
jgi:hypothetical protein